MSEAPIEHPSSHDRPPAANQPGHVDEPTSGGPDPTGSGPRESAPGPSVEEAGPVGGGHQPVPGDAAGVPVTSHVSAPGTSETSAVADDPVQPEEVPPAAVTVPNDEDP